MKFKSEFLNVTNANIISWLYPELKECQWLITGSEILFLGPCHSAINVVTLNHLEIIKNKT